MRDIACTRWRFILIVSAVAILAAAPAVAVERLALVIGNGAYAASPLANPVRDADVVADALEATGFRVTRLENADRQAMRQAVRAFADSVRAAGRGAAALFYYAGHGVQSEGRNFLIPVKADLRSAADLAFEAMDAQWALDVIGEANAGVSIVVLDACRNNPFKSASRGAARGLAQMDAPRGSILAYSTAPGETALDGDGANSPYSKALAANIRRPGLTVEAMFKQVRRSVLTETGGKQIPWESSSLVGDFYFAGRPAPGAAPPPASASAPDVVPGAVFRDCPDCPEMAAVAGGRFAMGSPSDEPRRVAEEGPETPVTVAPFAIGRTEVTRAQFRAFMEASGYDRPSGCWHWALVWLWDGARSWQNPGYAQTDDHPVVCVNWHDARAYAEWLSAKTGERYRLPTEAEWEYAAGADAPPAWVRNMGQACAAANVYDQTAVAAYGGWFETAPCVDGQALTSPVASYPPGPNGLVDMIGNVREWTGDCWTPTHRGRPTTSATRQDGDCGQRVVKGGHFASPVAEARPSSRIAGIADHPNVYMGFRVARDLR